MTEAPLVHAPVWQVSKVVQALPSLHVAPSAFCGFEQTPVAGAHVPARWHWSCGVHTTGLLPVHPPATQVSVCVHWSPSLHVVPSALTGFEHVPFAALHVPAAWH